MFLKSKIMFAKVQLKSFNDSTINMILESSSHTIFRYIVDISYLVIL